jgi:hypothetical protein
MGTALGAAGASCTVWDANMATQTDDCDVGLVCRNDGCGSRCYRFCQTDADCPGAACLARPGEIAKTCDVPFAACDPVGGAAASSCPGGGASLGCYLSAASPGQTVCDCPTGDQREGLACATSRDCLPGLACLDPLGGADLRCRVVCRRQESAGCENGGTCMSIAGSQSYGVCVP